MTIADSLIGDATLMVSFLWCMNICQDARGSSLTPEPLYVLLSLNEFYGQFNNITVK